MREGPQVWYLWISFRLSSHCAYLIQLLMTVRFLRMLSSKPCERNQEAPSLSELLLLLAFRPSRLAPQCVQLQLEPSSS